MARKQLSINNQQITIVVYGFNERVPRNTKSDLVVELDGGFVRPQNMIRHFCKRGIGWR